MADEKAPLLTEQGLSPTQAPPYEGEAQAPPPLAQAPPPVGGQPQAPPPQPGQYGGTYQQGYQNAPPPQQNTTVVVQPGNNLNPMVFGENPVQVTCPNCRVQNRTTVTYTAGLMTWLLVGALILFGFCLCSWIPLLVDACKDVNHICPNCHYTVGTYKRI